MPTLCPPRQRRYLHTPPAIARRRPHQRTIARRRCWALRGFGVMEMWAQPGSAKLFSMRTAQPGGADRGGGRLVDGTPYFGRLGGIAYDADEDKTQCHLCGEWFRLVGGKHLLCKHGISLAEYRELFQLPVKVATCSPGQSRAASERAVRNRTIEHARPHLHQPEDHDHRVVPKWRS